MFKKWMVLSALAMLFISGCSKDQQEEELVEEPVQEEGTVTPTEEEFSFHYPLTGEGTDLVTSNRAVAVMVNNHPLARPQSGLDQADIIYELLAEGEVTRFLAIFQSEQPRIIGPVRSARDYYVELAKGYDSVYIAHGNSPEAKEMLDSGYIDHLNGLQYDGTLFQRASFRKAPHNSYITYENILKGAEENHFEMDQAPDSLSFLKQDEVAEITGEPMKSAEVSYSTNVSFAATFEYDAELGQYKRFSNGELTADYDSGEPVLLDNILIVETEHEVMDDAGRREIDLDSGGRAYLLQKGKWNEVEWRNIEGRVLPFIAGNEAGLVPGKTWISVIPTSPGLEQVVTFQAE